jgi:hypothetical protein
VYFALSIKFHGFGYLSNEQIASIRSCLFTTLMGERQLITPYNLNYPQGA